MGALQRMDTLLLAISLMFFSMNSHAWCFYDSADLNAKCDCKSSPAKQMRQDEKDHILYTIENQVNDDKGEAISLVLSEEYPPMKGFLVDSPGGLVETVWFRTKKACQDTRTEALEERRASDKKEREEDKERLSPYE